MRKYNISSLQIMSYFEKIARSKTLDFFEFNGMYVFLVELGRAKKAVGPNGINVKKLREKFNKPVKIVEFSPDLGTFVRNLVFPVKFISFKNEDDIITIEGEDRKAKGLLIGRNAQALNELKKALERHFTFKDIKIV